MEYMYIIETTTRAGKRKFLSGRLEDAKKIAQVYARNDEYVRVYRVQPSKIKAVLTTKAWKRNMITLTRGAKKVKVLEYEPVTKTKAREIAIWMLREVRKDRRWLTSYTNERVVSRLVRKALKHFNIYPSRDNIELITDAYFKTAQKM